MNSLSNIDLTTLLSSLSWKIGQSLQEWGEHLLEKLAENTLSLQGALFSSDSKQENLYLSAVYATAFPQKLNHKIVFGEDLIGLVAKRKKTLILNENIPNQFNNSFLGEEIAPKSIIIIPVVYNDITYGVVEFTSLKEYTKDEISFLESIIKNIGIQQILLIKELQQQKLLEHLKERNIEIEEKHTQLTELNEEMLVQNTRLEDQKSEILSQKEQLDNKNNQIKEAYKDLELISEFGQKLTSSLNLCDISDMVYKYITSLMDTQAFGIGIYNEISNTIHFSNFKDSNSILPFFKKEIAPERNLSAWCHIHQKDLFINNLKEEYHNYTKQLPDFGIRPMPNSLLYTPLIVDKKTIGVITVNSSEINAYTKDDLINLKTLSSYVAIALDNAKAYAIIDKNNESINDSIQYAKTIQNAFFPDQLEIKMKFESFIFFKPRDIVSGDFYWYYSENGTTIVAAVDCTGHGVPGAFMSLIGANLLNEIVRMKKIFDPIKILEQMNEGVHKLLKQSNSKNDDGMDVCLCMIETEKKAVKNLKKIKYKLTYAGAKRPLYWYNSKEKKINIIKGSPKTVGGKQYSHISFYSEKITALTGDSIYLTSDGYTDQCNINRKSFGRKNFLNLIKQNVNLDMDVQRQSFNDTLTDFREGAEQRDDIIVLGIRFV